MQSAMTVPQEGADSQNSAFSEFFDETTDRIYRHTLFDDAANTGRKEPSFPNRESPSAYQKRLAEGIQNEDQIEVIIQKDTDAVFLFVFHQWNCAQLPAGCFCHAALSK